MKSSEKDEAFDRATPEAYYCTAKEDEKLAYYINK